MKILNILNEEAYQTIQKHINVGKELPPAKNDNISKDSGTFSKVNPSPNDPFTVNKISKDHRETYGGKYNAEHHDGYWSYITAIVNNDELKSNPFLPRVYSIKSYYDKEGNKKFIANIEKLLNYKEVDTKQLKQYIPHIIDIGNDNNYFDQYPLLALCDTIEAAAYHGNYAHIKNEKLIEALKFINSISNRYHIDLHSDNIMFRRTKYGIELVITDPLSFKKE